MHPQLPLQVLQLVKRVEADEKRKQQLLAANKAAARALLESISTVSYISVKKNESTQ